LVASSRNLCRESLSSRVLLRSTLGVFVAVALGCSAGRIRYEVESDGRVVTSDTYSFRSATLRAHESAWIVELQEGRYVGVRFHILPIANVVGVRITLPYKPDVDYEYRVGNDDSPCVVEVKYPFGPWRRVGPGVLRLSRWDPTEPYAKGTFEIQRIQRRGLTTGPVKKTVVESYEGSFTAPY